MMLTRSPLSFFSGPTGLFYSVTLPLLLALAFALVIIASSSVSGAKASKVGEASFHYLMQGLGILLMTIGAMPTLLSVLMGPAYPGRVYMSLLWVFLVGGSLFLWHEQAAERIERASTQIPQAIFLTVVRTIGYLIALFSGLSLLLSVALGKMPTSWWVAPVVMLLYGALLCWSTGAGEAGASSFQSISLHSVVKHPAKKPAKKHGFNFFRFFTRKRA
ncbi:MAG: hypothetical protein PHE68_04980 [Candidatus Peribacteraceae bacterium]|nr:hypothetical protein [Candidatus Peribacteraceae bacterium]